VGIYFSAHWCPPCRGFTPQLAKFYTDNLKAKGMEIVFVSSDRDQGSYDEYFGEMPWLALPFDQSETKAKLSTKFKVQGIPSFQILGPDGNLITSDGRTAVSGDPTGENYPWVPPSFAECLGTSFLKGDSTVGLEAIQGKTLGIYFSAHWCPPCRGFTPTLAKWYAGLKGELGDKFEIIFASSDRDEASFKQYYQEMIAAGGEWLALPYENRKGKEDLSSRFGVQGIPSFVIVDPEGKLINDGGRSVVAGNSTAADFPFAPPPIGDIESPDKINEYTSVCLMLEGCTKERQDEILDSFRPRAVAEMAKEEPELLFYSATKQGDIATRIRGMCNIPSATGQSSTDGDTSPVGDGPMVRVRSSEQPHIILMDIPDQGGYYVGHVSASLDQAGLDELLEKRKTKTDRKQLG